MIIMRHQRSIISPTLPLLWTPPRWAGEKEVYWGNFLKKNGYRFYSFIIFVF